MTDQLAFNIFSETDELDTAYYGSRRAAFAADALEPRPCEAPNLGAFDAFSARILEMSANRKRAAKA